MYVLAHIVVFGWYFAAFAPHWAARAASPDHGLGDMIIAVLALIIVSIMLAIIAAMSAPKEATTPYDEREKMIRLRAANITSAVVTTGALLVIGALVFDWNAVLAANLLLAVLVIGEIVKASAQIVQFRTSV